MKTGIVVNLGFFIGMIVTIIGSLMKLMHWKNADTYLIVGMIAWLVFIITSLYEVQTSKRITSSGKLLWTVAFVTSGGIAGIVYMLGGRKIVTGED